MQVSSAYFHSLNGRLRIKIAQVKGSSARALELESCLSAIDGIKYVKANPTTGNVLALYDHNRIGQADLIDTLKILGYLTENENITDVTGIPIPARRELHKELARRLLAHLAQVMVEAALRSLISALI
jgi:copper chaperone CopZ